MSIFKNIKLLLLALFVGSCAMTYDINPNEYNKFLKEMHERRAYPVLRRDSDVPMLVKALGEKSEGVRFNAAHDLKALGPKARDALIPLIERYADNNQKVAQVSFVASRKVLGEPYIPPAEPGWFSSPEKDPVDNLLGYLNQGTEQQKIWSLMLLTKMGDSAKRAVPKALNLLGEPSANIRLQAQGFLQKVETDLTTQLLEAILNKDPNIRSSACLILGLREEKSTINEVRKLLADSDPGVKFAAAETMARLGDSSAEVGNILSNGLGSVSASKEEQIIKLLNKIGFSNSVNSFYSKKASTEKQIQGKLKADIEHRAKVAAVKVREKLLRDREKLKRTSALSDDSKRRSQVEIPKFSAELDSGTVPQRVSALKNLSLLAPYYSEAFKPIVQALNNENPSVRAHAAKILGELRKIEAVDDLVMVLEDESVDVQDSAMAALSMIGTPEALAAISSFPEQVVRDSVNRTLRESSGQIQALVQCSDARSLCKLFLQESGSPAETINDEAANCAYMVQPGC